MKSSGQDFTNMPLAISGFLSSPAAAASNIGNSDRPKAAAMFPKSNIGDSPSFHDLYERRVNFGVQIENVVTVRRQMYGLGTRPSELLRETATVGGWYKTAGQVEALLALGALSEIKDTPETCVAYNRDMGEEYRTPYTFETVDEYQYRDKGRLAAEYFYFFDDGKGSVYEFYEISEWCDLNVVLETTNPKED